MPSSHAGSAHHGDVPASRLTSPTPLSDASSDTLLLPAEGTTSTLKRRESVVLDAFADVLGAVDDVDARSDATELCSDGSAAGGDEAIDELELVREWDASVNDAEIYDLLPGLGDPVGGASELFAPPQAPPAPLGGMRSQPSRWPPLPQPPPQLSSERMAHLVAHVGNGGRLLEACNARAQQTLAGKRPRDGADVTHIVSTGENFPRLSAHVVQRSHFAPALRAAWAWVSVPTPFGDPSGRCNRAAEPLPANYFVPTMQERSSVQLS